MKKKPAAKKAAPKAKAKPKAKAPAKAAKARPKAAAAAKKPAAKPAAKKKPPAKVPAPAAAEPAPAVDIVDDPAFAPATLQMLEKGGYAIFFDIGAFDDKLDVQDAFSAIGEGNGYEWEAVLAPALEKRDPQAFSAVDWSPEADTFVATSTDKAPLAVLAAVLRDVVKDQASLVRAIKDHDPDRT
ncbi:MAG: hypothetical protein KF773_02075 [Deltaproteobacteria bacterium]|nr:hypothetical protein [Deltaproteobacteria bacterium]MCW5806295.1 hypothetical protein [Deltaproteobacteria bacterium]